MNYRNATMYVAGALAALAIATALDKGWRHVGGDPTQGVLDAVRPAQHAKQIGARCEVIAIHAVHKVSSMKAQ